MIGKSDTLLTIVAGILLATVMLSDKTLWQTKAQRRQALSFNISTLLTRNLHDVFGENDPARRRAAIDEIFTHKIV
jgi:hypothetical protein